MTLILWLGLFLPLIGFLKLFLCSQRLNRFLVNTIGCASIGLSFLCFVTLFLSHSAPYEAVLFNWISVADINAPFALRIDTLSLLMTLIITGVGFLIHLYATGYMDHDEDFARFFACLNFFVFAMLILVLANNLVLLFVGWEGVGLASYLLIGFWYHKPTAANAASKAFIVNRIGDLGMLLGILLAIHTFGTASMAEISDHAKTQFPTGASVITTITLLLFVGACGKSAQFPLHVWLADAMEGPTPVSALIHAATMVTAGVYLVVRFHPLFLLAPDTMMVIACIGAATSLFAALCAVGQTDLKRVLAYSTVSQLGLMFFACGIGAFYAAVFHLLTHAFVKALLFLSAGNVVHMMHGTTEMDRMGGLHRIFKTTHILFLIGVLAMAGIPPLAAFFSKDLILEQGYTHGFILLFSVALTTSLLTAFYLTRAYFLTFRGKPNLSSHDMEEVHEAPHVMIAPLCVLAFLALFGGFLGFAVGKPSLLENFLGRSGVTLIGHEMSEGFHLSFTVWLSIGVAFLGIAAAAILYTYYAARLGNPIPLLKRAFFVDDLNELFIVKPLKGLGKFFAFFFEPKIFDGSLALTSAATQQISSTMQRAQSGQIRSYVAWMALGMVIMIVYFIF